MARELKTKFTCDMCGSEKVLESTVNLPVDWLQIQWQTEKMNVMEHRHICGGCSNSILTERSKRGVPVGPLLAAPDR